MTIKQVWCWLLTRHSEYVTISHQSECVVCLKCGRVFTGE